MEEILTALMGGIIGIVAIIFLISSIIKLIKRIAEEKKLSTNGEEEIKEPERTESRVRVSKKRILDSYEGVIVKSYVVDFLVTYRYENGESVECSVTKEIFDKSIIGEYGTLVAYDGAPDDYIPENESEEPQPEADE